MAQLMVELVGLRSRNNERCRRMDEMCGKKVQMHSGIRFRFTGVDRSPVYSNVYVDLTGWEPDSATLHGQSAYQSTAQNEIYDFVSQAVSR
jgi:hypothetical protein